MSIPNRAYNILRGYINREWERIRDVDEQAAERELNEALEAPRPAREAPPQAMAPVDRVTRAQRLLGVSKEARYGEVRKAYERLTKRSDPANFPQGSVEAERAAEIQKKVQWAYQTLSENVDVTEKRFQSLEIE